MRRGLVLLSLTASFLALPSVANASPPLQAGVGRADITPPTGYALGGWTRADRIGTGVQTRLTASALVLRSGHRKVALVSVDLFMAPGGLIAEAAKRAGHGFSARNVLVGATHTHSGPSKFANFKTLNTLAPSLETVTDPISYINFLNPEPADPQLYTFLVKRIATALRRANRDLGPAEAGWGTKRLLGVTDNRSLEAHLANHGIIEPPGTGSVAQDPDGYPHTIDPEVSVLRVDRVEPDGGRTPLGAFSTFADHGTVNSADYQVYTEDHFGPAIRLFESKMRQAGHVAARDPVINVFANSDVDETAAFDGRGPVAAERVGRAEAKAMFSAWLRAGRKLTPAPRVDLRWTRMCFCGQETSDGPVADSPLAGLPFLTGSEENRGPLFDVTHVSFEGMRSPVTAFGEAQGHKEGIPFATSKDSYPSAVPLFVLRIADRLLITEPGEASVETGRRTREAVFAAAKGMKGVRGVTLMGLTNEFVQYITTPEEYDRQHYEGGSTIYGPAEGAAISDTLADLAKRMRLGKPAPKPYPFDPRHGVQADGRPFGDGSSVASVTAEPVAVPPGAQAVFKWQGGPSGLDKRLDKRFIAIERRTRSGWRRVADDLGLSIVWTGDADGAYDVHWQVPRAAQPGSYRVKVYANLYRLTSTPFAVDPSAPATDPDPTHPAAMFAPVTRR